MRPSVTSSADGETSFNSSQSCSTWRYWCSAVAVGEHGVLVDGAGQGAVRLKLTGRRPPALEAVEREAVQLAHRRRTGRLARQLPEDASGLEPAITIERPPGGLEPLFRARPRVRSVPPGCRARRRPRPEAGDGVGACRRSLPRATAFSAGARVARTFVDPRAPAPTPPADVSSRGRTEAGVGPGAVVGFRTGRPGRRRLAGHRWRRFGPGGAAGGAARSGRAAAQAPHPARAVPGILAVAPTLRAGRDAAAAARPPGRTRTRAPGWPAARAGSGRLLGRRAARPGPSVRPPAARGRPTAAPGAAGSPGRPPVPGPTGPRRPPAGLPLPRTARRHGGRDRLLRKTKTPAATYSPRRSPSKYHRRGRA